MRGTKNIGNFSRNENSISAPMFSILSLDSSPPHHRHRKTRKKKLREAERWRSTHNLHPIFIRHPTIHPYNTLQELHSLFLTNKLQRIRVEEQQSRRKKVNTRYPCCSRSRARLRRQKWKDRGSSSDSAHKKYLLYICM